MSEPAKHEFVPEFKPGDTVILKSGGPLMTYERLNEDDELYVCSWFDQSPGSNQYPGGDKHSSCFEPGTLKKV